MQAVTATGKPIIPGVLYLRRDDITEKQGELLDAIINRRYNEYIWYGPARGAKGVGSANAFICSIIQDWIQQWGNGEYAVCGATAESFHRNNGEYLRKAAEHLGYTLKYRGGSNRHYRLLNKDEQQIAIIYIFGGNNERSYQTVLGATLTSAWIDEAVLCVESFVDTIIRRLTFNQSFLLMTMNSKNPLHFIKTKFIDVPKPKTYVMQSDFDDNIYYPEERKQDILQFDPNSVAYKRYVLNMWVGEEGQVIPIMESHLSDEEYQPAGEVVIDPGTASITAALLFVKTDYGYLVADEYYWLGDKLGRLTDDEHIDNILKRWQPREVIVDPAGASMRQAWIKRGFRPHYGRNQFEDGVQIVNNCLYGGKVKIHKNCTNLQSEASAYIWNTALNRPITGAPDHLLDCLRYGVVRYFPKRSIQSVLV